MKVCVTNSLNNAVAVEQKYAKSLLIDDLKVKSIRHAMREQMVTRSIPEVCSFANK